MFLNMANVIHHIHMNPRKTKFFEYLPHIELPKTIHNDDPNIVRLAIHSQGILVTADGRLRNSLVDANLIQKHRLTVVSPEEAIKYAGPNDPEPLLRP